MGKTSVLCVVCFTMLSMVAANGQQAPEVKPGKGLLLTIAANLDGPVTTLVFEAQNTGGADVETSPIGTNHNWIEVQRPDGRKVAIQAWKDGIQPTIIRPGESKTWNYDIAAWLKFDIVGRYRVTWHMEGGSAEIVLVKSKPGGEKVPEAGK